MLLKPFVTNSHGRIVFPCNFFPELDFSLFETLEDFLKLIRRDFGEKAPTEADVVSRVAGGQYHTKYDVCRDLALDLFWVNRYVLTMYEKRPTRWRDLPRHHEDIFLPIYHPRDANTPATIIQNAYAKLPAKWDPQVEDGAFDILLDVFRKKQSAGC